MPKGLRGFQKGHGRLRTIKSYRKLQTRKKLSEATTRQMSNPNYQLKLSKNGMWKGNKASYYSIHMWLRLNFGSAKKCDNKSCKYPKKNTRGKIMQKPKRYEWALIKGKKHEHKRENYYELCSHCHKLYDMGTYSIY